MGTPPRIHICEHRGQDQASLAADLRQAGWTVTQSTTLEESARRLARDELELVLLDPLVEAGEAELELVLGAGGRPPPALLYLVDGEFSEAARARLSEHAASFDLAPRAARTPELRWRAERLLAQRRQAREVEELRRTSMLDDRTELLRPKAFEQRLREYFSAAERHRFPLALLLLDLDRFGDFNKRRDHTFGDLVIARVGGVIRRNLRTEDSAGRLGGDEFGVVLPYTRPVEAAKVVRRLRDEIQALNASLFGAAGDLEVAGSLGFETFDGSDLDSVERLRAHAERALRAAKEQGGNCGVYFRSLPPAEHAS